MDNFLTLLGFFLQGITIQSPNILANAKQNGYTVTQEGDKNVLTSPDGYQFIIENKESNGGQYFIHLYMNAQLCRVIEKPDNYEESMILYIFKSVLLRSSVSNGRPYCFC